MFPEIGDLVFSLVVGYMGALEFLYVVRHLYHWSFRHNPEMRDLKSEAASLHKLQDQLRSSISEAEGKETQDLKAMKDGVLYRDGFRVDADQKEIDELKDKVKKKEQMAERQREIEAELARQSKIKEETRQQLKQAEDELRRVEEEKERQKLKEEEENARKILEAEKKKEEEQRRIEEEEKERERVKQLEEERNAQREREEMQRKRELAEQEEARKRLEAEREQEEKQRQKEIEEENVRRLLEAEREMEERLRQQELDDEEIIRKLLEAERKREQEEEEEENARKLLEVERKREESERLRELEEENTRKLIEAERKREQDEEEEENARKLLEVEREREEIERLRELEEENTRKLIEADRELKEEQQRFERDQARLRIEEEENYHRLLQMEREMEERERLAIEEQRALLEHTSALEREAADRLLAAERATEERQRMIEENEENMKQLLEVERELELKKQEMEEEAENLRRLIEAEKEMEENQRRIDEEALEKLKNAQEEIELRQTYDVEGEAEDPEQLITKKEITQSEQLPIQTVKTQYGQTGTDSIKPKTLHFPGVSEDSSSAEPISSQQSSFSAQQSSEAALPDMLFDEHERQAPDGGEDQPSLQYSDDYLRSLDGIKNKPLVREDGSGRRRAFKARRSSGSSTSSRESRASREEELKMFTSLEEQEFENIRKGDSEYEAIKYVSEPGLKVGKQRRRHKRSPAKDVSKHDANEAAKGPLSMLDEEDGNGNPWGEGKPEHYKDTDFWKLEKKTSIDEELEETDAKERVQSPTQSAENVPKMSSFEDATKSQHEEAISALQRQRSKDPEPIKEPDEESDTKNVSRLADASSSPAGSNSSSAFASASISHALKSLKNETERENSQETDLLASRTPSPSGTGAGLRRSPRVDEMKQYKENWESEDRKIRAEAGENPAIEIDYPSDDELMPQQENDYLMEGISDFYDFNASINPSRSRSRSRSKTPATNRSVSPHQHRSPSPQNVSHNPAKTKSRSPSPDPASYKFIYQRMHSNQAADEQDITSLSDFYDFNSKLNREALTGATAKRSIETHRTSVDYVMEDLTKNATKGGAIPKQDDGTPTSPEIQRSISADWRDIQKIKEELLSGSFKRSTYVGESMDFSDQFESLREEAKTFTRSRSRSRSPGYDISEVTTKVLAKKELQEKILDEIQKAAENLEKFSSDPTTELLVDRNRRASDTALIQKPEILFQIQDFIQESDENLDVLELEPEEYHHFRRFSLNQEIPVEQYPEDYVHITEYKVQSLGDLRNWTEDIETGNIGEASYGTETCEDDPNLLDELQDQLRQEELIEEAYESGSDDERQTVVEVEDEIDEDIWDYNERPEESHNEQSECEEADREMDRYADRRADDWRDVEGAVGGVLDEDSFQIDQIYDEAIKNRKASGILRDYDSILQEIQISDEDRLDEERLISKSEQSSNTTSSWSPRNRSSRASSGESSRSFLEYEKRENERRYLGDATLSAINSTRLRSRYGIVPSTSFTTTYDDDTNDAEINYVPKKEYNWRKNFKLDDDEVYEENESHVQYLDPRKLSLGGESITLFSQSPEHSEEEKNLNRVIEVDEDIQELLDEEMEQEPEELLLEKPKKKKSKRKSRKGSKGSIEDKENLSRRNSMVAEDGAPKKKSRKETKEAVDDAPGSPPSDAPLQDTAIEDSQSKKKSKKRRKNKNETTLPSLDIKLPSPEKKQPPPSVAALRAALTASAETKPFASSRISPMTEKISISATLVKSSVEVKQSISSRNSPMLDKESISSSHAKSSGLSPAVEIKQSTSSRNSSVSDKGSVNTSPRPQSPAPLSKLQMEQTSADSRSASLQPASILATTPNGELNLPKTPSPTDLPTLVTQTSSTSSNSDQNLDPPRNTSTSDTYDIIKDGGLYPLF